MLPFAALAAINTLTEPAPAAGAVQSNWNVTDPVVPSLVPVVVCSTYIMGELLLQVPEIVLLARRKPVSEQITCVLASVDLNPPATLLVLLARRAVAWKPQRRAEESDTVTIQCCTSPGTYVLPFGNAILTLPPFVFTLDVPLP